MNSPIPKTFMYNGKEFDTDETMINEEINDEPEIEKLPSPKTYFLRKPSMSLLDEHQIVSKPPHNHFQRGYNIKSQNDTPPTVEDIIHKTNVIQKCGGWKLQRLINQIDEMVELEEVVVKRLTVLLNKLEAKFGRNCADRNLDRVQELLKGNIQRSNVFREQMQESKNHGLKILKHKPCVQRVISKYNSKRPFLEPK